MSEIGLRQLYQDLQACQRRLGTANEAPDDFARVLSLAHDINNRLTTELMQLSLSDQGAIAIGPVCRKLLGRA